MILNPPSSILHVSKLYSHVRQFFYVHRVGVNFCGPPEFYHFTSQCLWIQFYTWWPEVRLHWLLLMKINVSVWGGTYQIFNNSATVNINHTLIPLKVHVGKLFFKSKYMYRYTSYESLSELVSVLIWPRTETSCIMSLMSRWRLKMSSSLLSGKTQYIHT